MSHQEIREKFLKFFNERGHKIVPSSSLLPNDPSILFTTAGMQQFKPYFLGDSDPVKDFGSRRVASIQKAMRTSDIDEVGDKSHLTFFEMLGHFSFGDYFKKETIGWTYEFLTEELGISKDRVSATVFAGDDKIPFDSESYDAWMGLIPQKKIKKGPREDNVWGPAGPEGPCGAANEVYVDDLEVATLVFMEYQCDKMGNLAPLPKKGVDVGWGLERIVMIAQGKDNIFETDLFEPFNLIIRGGEEDVKSGRIIADHIRGAIFLASDGLTPSNKEQGYILRRLIRRAMVHANKAEIKDNILLLSNNILIKLINDAINFYSESYPELTSQRGIILDVLEKEMNSFGSTLRKGLGEFHRRFPGMQAQEIKPGKEIEPFVIGQEIGKEVFDIYQSYGFPIEVIKELLEDRRYKFDEKRFRETIEEEKKKHQEISRAGADKKFGGHGLLMDTGLGEGSRAQPGISVELRAGNEEELKKTTRLHTATHLLHASLRKVLGTEVHQAGSDITPERLRFDFTFPRKVTPEEIKQVEDMVNEAVQKDYPVTKEEMAYEDAIKSGAMAFFKLKYPPRVNVYSVGDFSKELCGGPHVSHSAEIGHVKITKEEAVSAGVRRIRATVD